MIYALLLCNSIIGNCIQMPSASYFFDSPKQCIAYMLREFGPAKLPDDADVAPDPDGRPRTAFVNGRLYLKTMSPVQWFECDGKPTWQTVQ
jgi:hypothetical protein